MRIDVEVVFDTRRLGQAWDLYLGAFAELRTAAVQRHVLYRHEFDEVMTDERVSKYIAVDPLTDELGGLATFTNQLDAVPLISPEFFAHRWPGPYAEQRIWYLGFFAVAPRYRGSGVFEAVIDRLWSEIRTRGGVAALDVCTRNTLLGLPRAIQRTLERLTPHVITERVDEQVFWAYQLPDLPAAA